MRIEEIKIKNFKIFKDVHIKNIPQMMVLIGANSSGKTTFFDVFSFLQDALKENLTFAIEERGGFEEVISRGCDIEKDTISFEIVARSEYEKPESSNFFVTHEYFLEIGYSAKKKCTFVRREKMIASYSSNRVRHVIFELKNGEGRPCIKLGEIKTPSPDALYLKEYKGLQILKQAAFCNLQINSIRSRIPASGGFRHLSPNGENLARAARHLFDNHKEIFNQIIAKLPKKIPGLDKVEAKKTEEGTVILKFKNQNFKDPFLAENMSDGTLKMFAYLVLLNDPDPHPLLCIEEPENFLYVDLLPELCEEIRSYGGGKNQVFVSTHSPDFLDGADSQEVFYISRDENGFSQIKCANDDKLIHNLAKENKMGYLWRNHYIKNLKIS